MSVRVEAFNNVPALIFDKLIVIVVLVIALLASFNLVIKVLTVAASALVVAVSEKVERPCLERA